MCRVGATPSCTSALCDWEMVHLAEGAGALSLLCTQTHVQFRFSGFTLFPPSLEEEVKGEALLIHGKHRYFPLTRHRRRSSGSWGACDGI